MYESLTKHIPLLHEGNFGEWVMDTQNDGSAEHPIHMPYVDYSDDVLSFLHDFYQFFTDHQEVDLTDYRKILEENGIAWNFDSMNGTDVTSLEAIIILSLIVGVIRADRFSEGALLHFLESGAIVRWLERLKAID